MRWEEKPRADGWGDAPKSNSVQTTHRPERLSKRLAEFANLAEYDCDGRANQRYHSAYAAGDVMHFLRWRVPKIHHFGRWP